MTRYLCLLAILVLATTTTAMAQTAPVTPQGTYKNAICTVRASLGNNSWGVAAPVTGLMECQNYTDSLRIGYTSAPKAIYTEEGIIKATVTCRDDRGLALEKCITTPANGGAANP